MQCSGRGMTCTVCVCVGCASFMHDVACALLPEAHKQRATRWCMHMCAGQVSRSLKPLCQSVPIPGRNLCVCVGGEGIIGLLADMRHQVSGFTHTVCVVTRNRLHPCMVTLNSWSVGCATVAATSVTSTSTSPTDGTQSHLLARCSPITH